jgi:hypothetical protein
MHQALYGLFHRIGNYRQAIAEMRRTAALAPDLGLSEGDKTDAEALRGLPDLEGASHRPEICTQQGVSPSRAAGHQRW